MRPTLITVLIAALLASTAAVAADQEDATRVARDYMAMWQKGLICEAIDKHWDLDALLTDIGGKDYTSLNTEARNYLQALAALQLKSAQRIMGVQELISAATIKYAGVTHPAKGEYQCNMELTLAPDKPPARNAVVIRKVGGRMRIIDAVHNGKTMRGELPRIYKQVKSKGVTLEILFEQMVAQQLQLKIQRAMRKRRSTKVPARKE